MMRLRHGPVPHDKGGSSSSPTKSRFNALPRAMCLLSQTGPYGVWLSRRLSISIRVSRGRFSYSAAFGRDASSGSAWGMLCKFWVICARWCYEVEAVMIDAFGAALMAVLVRGKNGSQGQRLYSVRPLWPITRVTGLLPLGRAARQACARYAE